MDSTDRASISISRKRRKLYVGDASISVPRRTVYRRRQRRRTLLASTATSSDEASMGESSCSDSTDGELPEVETQSMLEAQ